MQVIVKNIAAPIHLHGVVYLRTAKTLRYRIHLVEIAVKTKFRIAMKYHMEVYCRKGRSDFDYVASPYHLCISMLMV